MPGDVVENCTRYLPSVYVLALLFYSDGLSVCPCLNELGYECIDLLMCEM